MSNSLSNYRTLFPIVCALKQISLELLKKKRISADFNTNVETAARSSCPTAVNLIRPIGSNVRNEANAASTGRQRLSGVKAEGALATRIPLSKSRKSDSQFSSLDTRTGQVHRELQSVWLISCEIGSSPAHRSSDCAQTFKALY